MTRKMAGIIIVSIFIVFGTFIARGIAATAPSYGFISFENNYQSILISATQNGYKNQQKELNSIFGKYSLILTKTMEFYNENLYLFFNENKELIYFSVEFTLGEGQSTQILEKLLSSIKEKLVSRYGESDELDIPYSKILDDKYVIYLKPHQSFEKKLVVTFKFLTRYEEYQRSHQEEVEKLQNEAVQKTVEMF